MTHYVISYFNCCRLGVGSTYHTLLCTEKFKEKKDKMTNKWEDVDCPKCLSIDKEIVKIKKLEEQERYKHFIKKMNGKE